MHVFHIQYMRIFSEYNHVVTTVQVLLVLSVVLLATLWRCASLSPKTYWSSIITNHRIFFVKNRLRLLVTIFHPNAIMEPKMNEIYLLRGVNFWRWAMY